MFTIYDINCKPCEFRYGIDAKECLASGFYFESELDAKAAAEAAAAEAAKTTSKAK